MHPHNIMPVPTVPSFVFRAKDWSVITGTSIASSSTWLRRDSSNRRLSPSSWCNNYGHFISALEVRWQTSYLTVTSGKALSNTFPLIKLRLLATIFQFSGQDFTPWKTFSKILDEYFSFCIRLCHPWKKDDVVGVSIWIEVIFQILKQLVVGLLRILLTRCKIIQESLEFRFRHC